jgi:hypothetical protein
MPLDKNPRDAMSALLQVIDVRHATLEKRLSSVVFRLQPPWPPPLYVSSYRVKN